jgi:hypothetical protein
VTKNEDDEKVVGMKEKLEQTDVLQTLENISIKTALTKDPVLQKCIRT